MRANQFQLRKLFEYVTICSILMAFAPILGMGAAIGLMLLTLSIMLRRGFVAILMLIGTLLAADAGFTWLGDDVSMGRSVAVIVAAGIVCAWLNFYRTKRSGPEQNRPTAIWGSRGQG